MVLITIQSSLPAFTILLLPLALSSLPLRAAFTIPSRWQSENLTYGQDLWATRLSEAVPSIEKINPFKKPGLFAIGERNLSCRWLQRTANALIEALRRPDAPSASLFWRPMVRAAAYGLQL
jgi:hypothetical protein